MGLVRLERDGWQVVQLDGRVDSFNQQEVISALKSELKDLAADVCIDLSQVEFVSLVTIQFFNELAATFRQRECQLAIVGGTDKTRRHIEIYGNLKVILLEQEFTDLPRKPSKKMMDRTA